MVKQGDLVVFGYKDERVDPQQRISREYVKDNLAIVLCVCKQSTDYVSIIVFLLSERLTKTFHDTTMKIYHKYFPLSDTEFQLTAESE